MELLILSHDPFPCRRHRILQTLQLNIDTIVELFKVQEYKMCVSTGVEQKLSTELDCTHTEQLYYYI